MGILAPIPSSIHPVCSCPRPASTSDLTAPSRINPVWSTLSAWGNNNNNSNTSSHNSSNNSSRNNNKSKSNNNNSNAGAWNKFNDVHVTAVDKDTVWREGVGGDKQASAYFLVYLRSGADARGETLADLDYHQHLDKVIPSYLAEKCLADNQAFTKEIESWDTVNLLKDIR